MTEYLPRLPRNYKHINGVTQVVFTATEMHEYGNARAAHARKQTLNEAVAICREVAAESPEGYDEKYLHGRYVGASVCLDRIKELK